MDKLSLKLRLKRLIPFFFLLLIVVAFNESCQTSYNRNNYSDVNNLITSALYNDGTPFIKAHFKNGDVCIFMGGWDIDESDSYLTGSGTRYNANRKIIDSGPMSIPLDSVAIFETNDLDEQRSKKVTAISIMMGIDLVLLGICATNPKACYGSCPTFYVNGNDNFHYSDAEGFSNAISPSMEYADIDAIGNYLSLDGNFTLTLKNEALETHCIDAVELLTFPISGNETVLHGNNDRFYLTEKNYELVDAEGPEGSIKNLIDRADRVERFSLADEYNLASKEELLIDFENIDPNDNLGLEVSFRQTLMTTYFIYSALSYMGEDVGEIMAEFESNEEIRSKLKTGITELLGGIEVYTRTDKSNAWMYEGSFHETGPIAFNRQVLPLLTQGENNVQIKLVMNKGLWRIDQVRLVDIIEEVEPIPINPIGVQHVDNEDEEAVSDLKADDSYLITMPGDVYTIRYKLPESDREYSMFIRSKGYYIEWMRNQWTKEKELVKLKKMVDFPALYLKNEARNYKEYERTMESEFWGSRVDAKMFTSNEN